MIVVKCFKFLPKFQSWFWEPLCFSKYLTPDPAINEMKKCDCNCTFVDAGLVEVIAEVNDKSAGIESLPLDQVLNSLLQAFVVTHLDVKKIL